jgi:FixJ family two-component response regulator
LQRPAPTTFDSSFQQPVEMAKRGGNEAVFVIDDDAGIREAIAALLGSIGLAAYGFATPQEFTRSPERHRPGCLVLDVRLPGISGLEFQRQLAAEGTSLPIVFITGHGDIAMSVLAMKAGAVDFLTKPFRDQDLIDAINTALLLGRVRRREDSDAHRIRRRFDALTERERDVMRLIVSGLLNKQAAARLGTTEATVKVQRGQVMRKMKAKSLPGLVKMATTLGLRIGQA